jgi:hypothetical protein
MKKVLSLLLAYVFFQVQSWAFAPVYPGNAQSLTGTYAGTMIGQVFYTAAGNMVNQNSNTLSANGTGVFVVGQPSAGLGTGVFAFFAQGTTYTGAVISIIDPTELTMTGVMKGEATTVETEEVVINGQPSQLTFTLVIGYLGVSFVTNVTFNQASSNGGSSSTRISGNGQATYQDGNSNIIGSSTVVIDGFLQSNTVSSTIDLSTLTNTQSSTGGGGGS